jgi:dGTPase
MYYHYRIIRMKQRAERYVARLFESYVHEPRQLPHEFQNQIEKLGVRRVVTDYIASMTDRSALLEYRQLFDPIMRP